MKHAITIGYLTIEDARDRRAWSGTHHFLLKELEKRLERVVLLGPLPDTFAVLVCKALNQVLLRITGKRFNWRAAPWVARSYARIIERRLRGTPVDLIIAPAGLSTIAHLRTSIPIIYINDRSIAGALGYHDVLQNLFDWSGEQSLATERAALRNATLSIFSSDWAADAAKLAAPDVADRVRMIPFGANLPEAPAASGMGTWPNGPLKLLFLGVYWEAKGGPIAYDALLTLKRAGVKAQLVVCGCDPPAECTDPDLIREGFLDKNKPDQLSRLQEHLRTADFLILPTRFEAYGIVFCEAAAYGLPVLATRTGGVSTVVQEGNTGLLFAPEEGGERYATAIEGLISDPARLTVMRSAARLRFDQLLNWSAFVDRLLDQALPLVTPRKAR
ncbi:MAG: glycosyltransferase family 4 protein [Flavobacteriales bacterium]|nr:glycosyltransferase family 4 protein [Flavobacteriales bacterium]